MIADVENQILNNKKHNKRYADIAKSFKKDREHIVHYTMKLRKKNKISKKERLKWIKMAKQYISKFD